MTLLFVSILAIQGCNNSSQDSSNDPAFEREKSDSVTEALKQLEADGALPELDTSDSLPGPDDDSNGIRDDIDRYLDNLDVSEKEKLSLSQYAVGLQRVQSAEEMTPEVAEDITESYMPSYFCMSLLSEDFEATRQVSNKLSAYTANTPSRTERFLEYNEAMDGSAVDVPSPTECIHGS
jgi:hypothetical protein